MSLTKLFPRLALVGIMAWLSSNPLGAQVQPFPLLPLEVVAREQPLATIEPVYLVTITVGTNNAAPRNFKFAFSLPAKFQLGGDYGHGLVKMSGESGAQMISFSVLDRSAESGSGTNALRQLAIAQYPDATITGDFSTVVGRHLAIGFDLQRKVGQVTQYSRIIFAVTPAGTLEFIATGDALNFSQLKKTLYLTAHGLLSTDNGKLEFPKSDGHS